MSLETKFNSIYFIKKKDAKITDAANESRDNVKYLYTLDKFFSSMTKASPVSWFTKKKIQSQNFLLDQNYFI